MNSGVQVLPPYQRSRGADWYKGTANAIYQNMNYIDRYDPDYVVVLSGDISTKWITPKWWPTTRRKRLRVLSP